ncbi:hybrid nucleoside-diphosphate sugar epimerase/sugar transferase [Psychrobacter sp. H7-1]|uniref:hybrid nucleoside-diphosphate sugar epimerase/sugar transferase n=1 Tax=Psychrobacter sp. H7-1 TaxID=1569265 RepID=UPI0022343E77|nr:hybrid nucleoside-diphosphate sugar epimerase/sugar transferase [Psychrobacter sp. H7-1]
MKRLLITGQSSYIAKQCCNFIDQYPNKYSVDLISVRDASWKDKSFDSYDAIIHTAALVHDSTKGATSEQFDQVNYQLTLELAEKAKKEGVKHFIFLSTMSVYGLNTGHITASTPLNPNTSYGQSKAKAEDALKALSSEEFVVTIIRPPMVYGPNCKGNFKTLYKIANIAPIFPKVNNQRSAIFIDNLSAFIKIVIDNKIEGTLFPQNEEYLNTSETVSLLAKASSRKVYISKLAGFGVNLLMFSPTIQKAFGSLTYDPSLPGGPIDLEYNLVKFDDSVEQSAYLSKAKSGSKRSVIWQRPLDIAFSVAGLVATSPLLIGTTIVGYFDTGSPLFIQERVGKDKKPFKLVKFRTMSLDTASVASHLADNSSITKLGRILRKTKLDELPQLINVLKGEMSLVGPRPNLFNQEELIEARGNQGVYDVLPGITGLAQLSGIDMSTPDLLAKTDKEMIDSLTLQKYFSYIIRTALGKGSGDAVK